MTQQERKLELYDIIDRLTNLELFTGLNANEGKELEEAQTELYFIETKEMIDKYGKATEVKKQRRKVDKQFKRDEDWGNEQLGLKREGHMKRGISCPDGVSSMFSVDYTRTGQRLAFIEKEMKDAEKHATQSRVPVLVIFVNDKRREDGYAVMRFKNFRDLHGG